MMRSFLSSALLICMVVLGLAGLVTVGLAAHDNRLSAGFKDEMVQLIGLVRLQSKTGVDWAAEPGANLVLELQKRQIFYGLPASAEGDVPHALGGQMQAISLMPSPMFELLVDLPSRFCRRVFAFAIATGKDLHLMAIEARGSDRGAPWQRLYTITSLDPYVAPMLADEDIQKACAPNLQEKSFNIRLVYPLRR
jgi:hypothetical protein